MKLKFILVACIFLLILSSAVYATSPRITVPPAEKDEILEQLDSLKSALNTRDADAVLALLSPNAPQSLRDEIDDNIRGKQIWYSYSVNSWEYVEAGKVKVSCTFSAFGQGWSISGLSNYFVFEKSGDTWLIVDTDFHKKLSADYIFGMIGMIFGIILVIIIVIVIGIVLYLRHRNKKRMAQGPPPTPQAPAQPPA